MRVLRFYLLLGVAAAASVGAAETIVARDGRAQTTVLVSGEATPAERYAAEELARWLGEIAKVTVPVSTLTGRDASANSILVGRSEAADRYFPGIDWDALGMEQMLVRSSGNRTLVAGGRPRGTLYAVYRLLHGLGCRWWTPWAQSIPVIQDLVIWEMMLNEQPAFESRDSFWFPAFNGDWAARNMNNGLLTEVTEKHGGKVAYAGFVHTFYPLVPPAEHAAEHPEWYSLIDGKRDTSRAQLCTTNPELRAFMARQVMAELEKNPEATIVSVSQNDWYRPCQCENCQALVAAQGSEAGPMIALANYIAAAIARDYPHVAVDTLAYQYSRKAPKSQRPLPNVIVRLCSIECSFAQPLTAPQNEAFANDIRDWSRLTDRLYIWNYNTNFAAYPQPFPNYFVLADNVQFFKANGVKGVFEQGAYQSNGADMAEMRAWVQARLLYNPHQDDSALIAEFLQGYYGPAWRPINQYLHLMADAAKGVFTSIYDRADRPYLSFDVMRQAEAYWQQALDLTVGMPDYQWRVKQGHLSTRYVWLTRWNAFRSEAVERSIPWPLPTSRKRVADEWLAVATGPGSKGWSPMTVIHEGGLTPQDWIKQFAVDPAPPAPLPTRNPNPPLPADLDLRGGTAIDLQDNLASLWNKPEGASLVGDRAASDGIAARMPGSHREWAFQIPTTMVKNFEPGRYRVVVVVRAEGAETGPGCTLGAYDSSQRRELALKRVDMSELIGGYKSFDLGLIDLSHNAYIYAAPPARTDVTAVWVDRVILVRE